MRAGCTAPAIRHALGVALRGARGQAALLTRQRTGASQLTYALNCLVAIHEYSHPLISPRQMARNGGGRRPKT